MFLHISGRCCPYGQACFYDLAARVVLTGFHAEIRFSNSWIRCFFKAQSSILIIHFSNLRIISFLLLFSYDEIIIQTIK